MIASMDVGQKTCGIPVGLFKHITGNIFFKYFYFFSFLVTRTHSKLEE